MKKYTLTLLFQLLASTVVLIAEANTVSLNLCKANETVSEEKDLEMETVDEKEAFPDLITFALYINQ